MVAHLGDFSASVSSILPLYKVNRHALHTVAMACPAQAGLEPSSGLGHEWMSVVAVNLRVLGGLPGVACALHGR